MLFDGIRVYQHANPVFMLRAVMARQILSGEVPLKGNFCLDLLLNACALFDPQVLSRSGVMSGSYRLILDARSCLLKNGGF